MPKIIPDLGPRILQAAAQQFVTKGFARTDMKSLAAEVGISVGTLYNYYPSKPELFLAVSLLWKDELSRRLLERLDREESATVRLRTVLLMLYEDMAQFTGIWHEFLRSGARMPEGHAHGQRFKADNEDLYRRMQELCREVWANHPHAAALVEDGENRLGRLLVGSIMQMVMGSEPRLAEGNRAFVEHWIDFVAPLPPEAPRN